jgi:hypothetical protein
MGRLVEWFHRHFAHKPNPDTQVPTNRYITYPEAAKVVPPVVVVPRSVPGRQTYTPRPPQNTTTTTTTTTTIVEEDDDFLTQVIEAEIVGEIFDGEY